jgi:hypothetical protein
MNLHKKMYFKFQVQISYQSGNRLHPLPPHLHHLGRALASGNDASIADAAATHSSINGLIINKLLDSITKEIQSLCSKSNPSILRKTNIESLKSFEWKSVLAELEKRTPCFIRFLKSCIDNPSHARNTTKKSDSLIPALVSAACKLIHTYCSDLNLLQYVNSIILLKGGAKKSTFRRLQLSGDCSSYQTVINAADRIAGQWAHPLLEWKKCVEDDTRQESAILKKITDVERILDADGQDVDHVLYLECLRDELSTTRTFMHPGYYFVGDNVDLATKVRHITNDYRNQSQHLYQICAYECRVSGNHLSDDNPIGEINKAIYADLGPV